MDKILVFGMTENPGGVESFLLNYYRKINKNKFQFDFLCNSYEKVAYEDELIKMGGKTFHFTARSQNPLKYRKELNQFFEKHAKEYKAIWVNVCSLANIDYLKLAKKYGINRRIIHSHNSQNMDSRLRGILHEKNKKNLEKYATDYWACSEDAAEWFYKKELLPKAIVIHNAIDVERMSFQMEKRDEYRRQLGWQDCYIIGNVGRLHFQKNQAFVIKIFEQVLTKIPEARLLLIGQGEDEAMLKEKVAEAGLEDFVVFTGVQYNVVDWLSTMDFFLFPSVFEGLGIAVLEAQANGVPSLTSAKVVPSEVVINSNCEMEHLEDGAAQWAEKIIEMKQRHQRLSYDLIKRNFVMHGYDINTEMERLEELLSK